MTAQAHARVNTASKAGAAKASPTKPLTEKQRSFVRHWVAGESLPVAARKAGYASTELAYRLCAMPNIVAVYNDEKRKYEEACAMTRKRVMDGFLEGIEAAKLVNEPSSVIAGWREIGKMCGYYEPVTRKLDINVNGSVVMQRMNRMSDADLLRLIQQGISAPVELEHDESLDGDDDELGG